MLLSTRWCRGRVSERHSASSRMPSAARTVTTQNTPRQPAASITKLPASGARIGETLNTSISSDISRAASVPVCRSRTTARGITMPAQAPSPCTKRKAISVSISGAKTQPMLPARNTARPI